jgi:outer membrane protein
MKTIILLLLAAGLSPADDAVPLLTRAQALRTGSAGNFALQEAAASQESAEAGMDAARGALLPGLGLTSTFTRVGPNLAGDPRTSSAVSVAPDQQWSNAFQLSWSVLNFGALGTWRSQAATADAARIHSQGQTVQLLAAIDLAYHDVVRQQALLGTQRQELDLSRARRDIAKAHREIGISSALELMQAQLAVDADSSALLSQETAFDLSRRNLDAMMGRGPRGDFRVEDTILVDDPGSFERILSEARAHQSGLAEASAKARALRAQANAAAASAIAPVVSLYTTYTFFDRWHDQNPPSDVYAQGMVYGVQATWSLFSGGSQIAQSRSARALARSAELAAADSALQLEKSVVQGWAAWTRARAALELGSKDDALADSTLALAMAQYKVGAISGIDLRQAQESALQAKTLHVTTRWNARSAELQLLVLAGRKPL